MTEDSSVTRPKICEEGGSGIFLPLSHKEHSLPNFARAFLYFMVLSWCFLGTAIAADIFMGAIEAVTSKRKCRRVGCGRRTIVKVWNPTVANLTLMALGSSAPEILLSVIELVGNSFYSGELGPSTIVGSAAFNLLVIIAICVVVIPAGENRTIEQVSPFLVTAASSIFAYLWLIVILSLSTPDIVDPWEGVATFLFFPAMVVIAYFADIGVLSRYSGIQPQRDELIQSKLLEEGVPLTTEEVKMLAREQDEQRHDSKTYAKRRTECGLAAGVKLISVEQICVGVVTTRLCVPPNRECPLMVEVEKSGAAARESRVGVEYAIVPVPANGSVTSGFVELPAGRMCATIDVDVQHMNMPQFSGALKGADTELDECFRVELVHACKLHASTQQKEVDLAGEMKAASSQARARISIKPERSKAHVSITGEDGSGQLRFERVAMTAWDTRHDVVFKVPVERILGCSGEIACHFATEGDSAKPAYDYFHTEGELVFPPSVMEQTIEIHILRKDKHEASDRMFVVLADLADTPGIIVKHKSVCSVTIEAWDSVAGVAGKLAGMLDIAVNLDAFRKGAHDWREQFLLAFRPGDGDVDSVETASPVDWTIHFISLPWKILFAFIPPTAYCDGWLCFILSLVFIGVVTAIVGDLASLLGCCMNLPDSITAITIVALGTSLPDAFASKLAAVQDTTADCAIGNVTGSNSVNVFLGLGIPWMTASIFWARMGPTSEWSAKYPEQSKDYPSGGFVVVAGDLAFSVFIFTLAAVAALSTIWYRRVAFQAELGGPESVKIITVILFVCLWFFYISLASWKVLAGDVDVGAQAIAVLTGLCCVIVGVMSANGIIHLHQRSRRSSLQDLKDTLRALVGDRGVHDGSWVEIVAQLRSVIAGLSVVCESLEETMKAQGATGTSAEAPTKSPRRGTAPACPTLSQPREEVKDAMDADKLIPPAKASSPKRKTRLKLPRSPLSELPPDGEAPASPRYKSASKRRSKPKKPTL